MFPFFANLEDPRLAQRRHARALRRRMAIEMGEMAAALRAAPLIPQAPFLHHPFRQDRFHQTSLSQPTFSGIHIPRDRHEKREVPLFGRQHDHRQEARELSIRGYELVKKLATGGMSEAVNLVKEKSSGKLYIEKRVRITNGREKRTSAELNALKRITNEAKNLNRLHTYEWFGRRGFCTFILEYCDGGSLQDQIAHDRQNGRKMPEAFAWHLLVGIAKALSFLHFGVQDATREKADRQWNTLCHLDLKPCNVFFSSTDQDGPFPRVVVGDFGCAICANDILLGMEHPAMQMCGTPEWYPPEGLPEKVGMGRTRYGPSTDIWMMGATVQAACRRISTPDRRAMSSDEPCGGAYGRRINRAVKWCTYRDDAQRPSAPELVVLVAKIRKEKGLKCC